MTRTTKMDAGQPVIHGYPAFQAVISSAPILTPEHESLCHQPARDMVSSASPRAGLQCISGLITYWLQAGIVSEKDEQQVDRVCYPMSDDRN